MTFHPIRLIRALRIQFSPMPAIDQWIAERCEVKADARETTHDLHRDYRAWCLRHCQVEPTRLHFTCLLEDRGFHAVGKSAHGYERRAGLALKA